MSSSDIKLALQNAGFEVYGVCRSPDEPSRMRKRTQLLLVLPFGHFDLQSFLFQQQKQKHFQELKFPKTKLSL